MKIMVCALALFTSSVWAACPEGFIEVPANTELGVKKAFCVMKYSAKAQKGSDKKVELIGCNDLECKDKNWASLYNKKSNPNGYKPVSVAEGAPWRGIDYSMAKASCKSLGKGFDLINNNEWMTIANNIESVNANWSGNKVGVGFLNRGHSDANPDQPCDSSLDNVDGNCSTKGTDFHQRRTHKLSNGQMIWDIAGNTWEWVDWKISFGKTASPADAWVEYARLRPEIETGNKLDKKQFTSLKNPHFTSRQNIGKYWSESPKTSESVAIRGSRWNHNGDSGIYALDLSVDPNFSGPTVGFRCVKR